MRKGLSQQQQTRPTTRFKIFSSLKDFLYHPSIHHHLQRAHHHIKRHHKKYILVSLLSTLTIILASNTNFFSSATNFSIGADTGTFVINNDTGYTNTTGVTLYSTLTNANQMRFGNTAGERDSA